MTIESLLSVYQFLMTAQIMLLMVTVGMTVWRLTTRDRYRGRSWYANSWMCPGIYRIYGDANPFRTVRKRILGYLIAFIVIFMTYGLVGSLVGMLALRDFQRTAIFRDAAAAPLTGGALIAYVLPVAIGLLHIICVPEERSFKLMRVILPVVIVLTVMVVSALGILAAEQHPILRFTYGVCRVFPGNPICETVY